MAAKCHRVVWGRRTTACTSVFQTTLSPRGNSPELVNTTVEWKFDGFYGEYRWRRHVFAPLPNQITPTRMFHSCFYLNIVKGKESQQIFYIFERSLHKSTHPTTRHSGRIHYHHQEVGKSVRRFYPLSERIEFCYATSNTQNLSALFFF
jgi:hypothetical protein